ncbi:hypothetical protein HD597_005303 [Nonomuraea thailandensis]|uniref:Erythromycin biosynthesis protein CIII-like C-terminal domain-containing protein n=1 Tax=Nonomuraea thailandensis TaxID=1188745 RepID=A0A9X2K2R7_9ACTN|nr:glycosyltransferase [Nonomuraea thailandensis]MCP2358283.1 hypothetical protein [Nonomuraea thailandensis]
MLQGFSTHVLPDGLDYPPWAHTTGFWFVLAPAGWAPSPELAAFLAAGDRPVYIGFGSMAGNDPERVGRVVAEAVRLAGVRAMLASGWGGLRVDDLPDNVFLLEQAPHGWLFPRMAAIVHHGGSGTTGAALAAGRPQVVCPFVADQPFWAARVHAAGVAPPPQPQRRPHRRRARRRHPPGPGPGGERRTPGTPHPGRGPADAVGAFGQDVPHAFGDLFLVRLVVAEVRVVGEQPPLAARHGHRVPCCRSRRSRPASAPAWYGRRPARR